MYFLKFYIYIETNFEIYRKYMYNFFELLQSTLLRHLKKKKMVYYPHSSTPPGGKPKKEEPITLNIYEITDTKVGVYLRRINTFWLFRSMETP